ncbi:MAG: hypothetical protein HUJ51_02670 [Eggerthellaceae bacterium]|nr:hypothetical protein [Eggerthellaceae bacterium]
MRTNSHASTSVLRARFFMPTLYGVNMLKKKVGNLAAEPNGQVNLLYVI